MRSFGVMQGRLLPKYLGHYQAFPANAWRQEFAIANGLGLGCIEFILDKVSAANPLLDEKGLEEIKALMQKTGVKVYTICADYFMSSPLFAVNKIDRKKSLEVLKTLIRNGKLIGVTDIVIPCVDESSMFRKPSLVELFRETLAQAIPLAGSLGVNLALETDFPPKPFLDLLQSLNSECIKVNYDTGNSASLGYDVRQEMEAYGQYVSTVHIKDRKRSGGSVILGTGDANIDLAMSELQRHNFQGYIILQPYRDDQGVEIFKQQLNWFKAKLPR